MTTRKPLLEVANEAIAQEDLQIVLGVQAKGLYYHSTRISSKSDICAVFQLMGKDHKPLIETSGWNQFLSLIQREYGLKFMRETGLEKLFEKDGDEDDY